MGNNNALILTQRARTFMGSQATYGMNKNPGGRVNNLEFVSQGQRWHFTLTLPSTAVAVKAGKQPTTSNIEEVCNNKHVILTAVDIKVMGLSYALKADVSNTNGVSIQTVKPDGTITEKTYDITDIPKKVVTVTSSNKSSKDDLSMSGTH